MAHNLLPFKPITRNYQAKKAVSKFAFQVHILQALHRGGVVIPTFGVTVRAEPDEWVTYCKVGLFERL
jgi:hypothetical protein